MQDIVGRPLGKYRLEEHLGSGSTAAVYKAYQPNLGRYVAIKLMHASLIANDRQALARFEREAKNMAALRHPNIVQVYDFDVEGDTPYIVMELIEGASLKAHLERLRGRGEWLSVGEAVRIVREVGQALSYANGRQMVHRDIKPANVMMDTSGRAILTDFGIAQILSGPHRTMSGMVVGTPTYMAPEQGRGLAGDPRSDIYSLGVVLYELLTGRLPYDADTPAAVILKHIAAPLPPPRLFKPDLPEWLERVIVKGLEKNLDDRFQSVDEMLASLPAAAAGPEAGPGLAWLPSALAMPEAIHPSAASPASLRAAALLARSALATQGENWEGAPRDITPPPQPAMPPRIRGFVGREAELAHLAEKLAASHLVILTGMPGIGKTTLAAVLAARLNQPARTFWHSFHAGEGVNALMWKLAGFLFWKNQPQLWNTLQRSQETGVRPPPPEVLFDYVFQRIQERDYVLCFDDFHFVEEDPLLGEFMDGLREVIEAGDVSVILTSRHKLKLATGREFEVLPGLSLTDIRQLSAQLGLSLPAQLLSALHKYTEGNAHLLTLALDGLQRSSDPARLISRLSESEHVERFLMQEVDGSLTPEERQLMSAVAVFLGYPCTRDAISSVLAGHGTRRALNDLASRYLLTVTDGEVGKEYSQHALVQPFYYDLLDRPERQAMHLRAGEFYEEYEPDVLKAARHFQRAGQESRAAALVTADVWAIINQGQAQPLRQLLAEGFTERTMTAEPAAAINLARGQVYALLGETSLARTSYQAAYAHLAGLPATPAVRELTARACHGLGELLQYEAPQEALDWLRRGLDLLGGASALDEAALRIRTGRLLAYLGKNAEALAQLQSGLALLPEGPSRLRLSALGNLGNIFCVQGDAAAGLGYYRQVLEIARQLQDHWAIVEVWINIGIELDIAGQWVAALAQYQQALAEAEHLGSARQLLRAKLAMVNTHLKLGADEAARQGLLECRRIAQRKGWKDNLVYIDNALAEVCLREGNLSAGDEFLTEGEQLANETGVREPLPDLYRQRALIRLRQGRPADALAYGLKAVGLARELEDKVFEGTSLRALGQAHWANNQEEAAQAAFEQSLALLAERDPYEHARTQLAWGQCLRSAAEAERGQALLGLARATFERLGARHELAVMEE